MAFGKPVTVRALAAQSLVSPTRLIPQGEIVTVMHSPFLARRLAAGEVEIVELDAVPAPKKKEA